jgi:putative aldouronate transport system substrate-binding protein
MGMIPMSGYIEFPPMSLIEAAYLNVGEDRLRRKDGQISYTPIEEAWREAMITTNRLVNEGLLDRNGFSQTKDQFTRLAMDPAGTQVAVLPGQSQGEFAEVNFSDPNARFREFEPLKPFTGPDGNAYVAWRYNPGHNVGLVLTSKTRNPEELIRWADYQTGLVSTLSMRLGTLDEHWGWAAEGETGIDGRQAVYKKTATPSDENDVWWEMGPYNLVMDVRHGEFVDEPTSIEPALYRAGKMYEPFAAPEEEYFLEPFFTVEQAAQVGELKVNLDNAFTQGRANFALGNADPANDKDWENYVNSLKGAGLDRYLEILKAADDASNG